MADRRSAGAGAGASAGVWQSGQQIASAVISWSQTINEMYNQSAKLTNYHTQSQAQWDEKDKFTKY